MEIKNNTKITTTLWIIASLIIFWFYSAIYISKLETKIAVIEQEMIHKADKEDLKIVEVKLANIEALLVEIRANITNITITKYEK